MKNFIRNSFVVLFLVLVFINTISSQVKEIKRTKKFKFSEVIPIHENENLAGYIFIFKKNGKYEDEVEFVITDMIFNEVKRESYKEREYTNYSYEYMDALKKDSSIYIKYQIKFKVHKDSYPLMMVTINFGVIGGLIYVSAINGKSTSGSEPKLELLREINLTKNDSASYQKRLNFKPDFGLTNNFRLSYDSLKNKDFIYNLYPKDNGILAIHTTVVDKKYVSNDSIFFMDTNHLIKWKHKIKDGSAGLKHVAPLIKNFTYFNQYLVINNSADLQHKNFGSYITFLDTENGNVLKEMDINRDYHARINQYNEFKFVKNENQTDKLLLVGRSSAYGDIKNCDGIYLNFIDSTLKLSTPKKISWTELNNLMPEKHKAYFTKSTSLSFNNVYWVGNKILILLQENTNIGYADLFTILLDENFNIIDFSYNDQNSKKQPDITSTPIINGNNLTVNLFRKEVSLELNQLELKDNKVSIKKINKEVDFLYEFAIEGINSVVFGGIDKESKNVLLKEVKLE